MQIKNPLKRIMLLFGVIGAMTLFLFALTVKPTKAAPGDLRFTIEAPGVQASQVSCSAGLKTEAFDDPRNFSAGQYPHFISEYTLANYWQLNGPMFIRNADQFGGAGGTGRYIETATDGSYRVFLSEPSGYFGFWLSSGNGNGQVKVYMTDHTNQTFSTQSIFASGALQGNSGTGTTNGHYGNPTSAFLNQDTDAAFVYVNIFATNPSAKISTVEFIGDSGVFRSDNHSNCADMLTPSGTPIPQLATVTIKKEANPESSQSFAFASDLPGHNFDLVDDGTGTQDSKTITDIPAGEYLITEAQNPGWQLDSITCDSGDYHLGDHQLFLTIHGTEHITCTFTNVKPTGTIIIKKQTVPSGGTGYTFIDTIEAPFSFSLDDGQTKTFTNVKPDEYAVTEAILGSGEYLSGLVCDDTHSATPSTVNIANRRAAIHLDPGETVTCTFTNSATDVLIVEKVTHPAGGLDYDFELTDVNGTDPFTLSDGEQEIRDLIPGTYTITEADHAPEALTALECGVFGPGPDDFTVVQGNLDTRSVELNLAAGQGAHCYFENTSPAVINIVKEAEPKDGTPFSFELSGGTTENFTLSDDGSGNDDIASYQVMPGDYQIHEVVTDGWKLENIDCLHGDGTQINTSTELATAFIQHLAPGDYVTCTFQNEKHGSITVKKEAYPADDTEFPFVFLDDAYPIPEFFTLQVPSHPSETIGQLEAGYYLIAEDIPAGWGLYDLQCQSALGTSTFDPLGSAVAIELGTGDDVTCTYQNAQTAKITIVKNAAPADGTDFDFTVSGDLNDGFTLDDANPDDNDGIGESVVYDVLPGSYVFTETVTPGWTLQNIACIGSGNSTVDIGAAKATIQVQSGQDTTCAFFNVHEEAAEDYIIIEKVTVPAGAVDFDFEVYENGGQTVPFTLDDGEIELIAVSPDSTYTVTELFPGNDVNVTIECFGGGSPQFSQNGPGVTLTFGPAGNEAAWCTFTNTQINFCPAQDPNVDYLLTDLLGTGAGKPKKGRTIQSLNVPNSGDVDSLYAQLAAVDIGVMKWVRFTDGVTDPQINAPTSQAYRLWAVNWWGASLEPAPSVWGTFFWGPRGNRAPRAFVLWPTYNTSEMYANVFQTFDDSTTNHVYFRWIPEQVQTITIPETQIDGADILVKVAVVDNQKDARPYVLTVTAGNKTVQVINKAYLNKNNALNLDEILLEDVDAGVDEVEIRLLSPDRNQPLFQSKKAGGDSVAMIGAAVSYGCEVPSNP